VLPFSLWSAQEDIQSRLEQECFRCHEKQKIPSEAIYRRYLLKYSSRETIRRKIFGYLSHPSAQRSIMPPQFFNKFAIKAPSDLDEKQLHELIDAYIAHFDIAGKLRILPQE